MKHEFGGGNNMRERIGQVSRKTKETDISLSINLDGQGENQIDTGIPFFDHMLDGFARHGLFDLEVSVKGDVDEDSHHTIEDTGIVLGQDRKSTRLNSSHVSISYAVFCLKKKKI